MSDAKSVQEKLPEEDVWAQAVRWLQEETDVSSSDEEESVSGSEGSGVEDLHVFPRDGYESSRPSDPC